MVSIATGKMRSPVNTGNPNMSLLTYLLSVIIFSSTNSEMVAGKEKKKEKGEASLIDCVGFAFKA